MSKNGSLPFCSLSTCELYCSMLAVQVLEEKPRIVHEDRDTTRRKVHEALIIQELSKKEEKKNNESRQGIPAEQDLVRFICLR